MQILKNFKKYENFLSDRTAEDERDVTALFDGVAEYIDGMGAAKLALPDGFVRDLGLYLRKKAEMVEYFEDVERRYLLLSDLYGYLKLKGEI
jgi:hypothetical protein